MALYTSEEWKVKWVKAQEKVDSILEDIELKKANNDKDSVELSDYRLRDALMIRDDYEAKYYQALKEENGGSGVQIGLTSMVHGYYGY